MTLLTTYRKPNAICKENPFFDEKYKFMTIPEFVNHQKKEIREYIDHQNLKLEYAKMEDMEEIFALRNQLLKSRNHYSPHWYYHLINFGCCIILRSLSGKILSYTFEVTYGEKDRTSMSSGMGLLPEIAGLGIGKKLVVYMFLEGMEKKAKFCRGFITTTNYPSISIGINYLGGIITEFFPNFSSYGSRIVHSNLLTIEHLTNAQFDQEKGIQFVKDFRKSIDYQLIRCNDTKALHHLYEKSEFKIAGLFKRNKVAKTEMFLALSPDLLDFS